MLNDTGCQGGVATWKGDSFWKLLTLTSGFQICIQVSTHIKLQCSVRWEAQIYTRKSMWRKSPFTTSLCFLSIRPIENWKMGSVYSSRANHMSITFEKMFSRKCCLLELLMVDECKRCTCCATVYRYNQSVAPEKPWGGTSAFNFEMTQALKNAKHYSTCWNAAHFPFFQFPVTRQRTNLLCLSSNFSATPLLCLPVIRFKAHQGGEGCEIICGCNYGLPSLE